MSNRQLSLSCCIVFINKHLKCLYVLSLEQQGVHEMMCSNLFPKLHSQKPRQQNRALVHITVPPLSNAWMRNGQKRMQVITVVAENLFHCTRCLQICSHVADHQWYNVQQCALSYLAFLNNNVSYCDLCAGGGNTCQVWDLLQSW